MRLFLSCLLLASTVLADADISYLVADFKFSHERGVKICEVQHGSLSALAGDLHVFGGDGSISPKIADYFARFSAKKWAVGLIYPPLKRSLAAKGWKLAPSINALVTDPQFLELAKRAPTDPHSVDSYPGIVYADLEVARNIDVYRKSYPGILFVNAATFPYWVDKYKMNTLFERSQELKSFKADWKLYPKRYDPLLSSQIREDMPSELYVIKPRGEALANGVIVVEAGELDKVLKMILNGDSSLQKHPDKKYAYWKRNKDETFLVERYERSDYLSEPLHYDATMRLAFILQHDDGKRTYHSLGGFWKLPPKALEEEGTLNEKRISICKAPFYRAVEPELLKEADAQMEKAMLLLYKEMLHPPSKDLFAALSFGNPLHHTKPNISQLFRCVHSFWRESRS